LRQVREYRFQATDDTIASLRRLRSAWQSFEKGEMHCAIVMADGDGVRVEVDTVDVEGVFDAYRIAARAMSPDELTEHARDIETRATNASDCGNSNGTSTHQAPLLPAPSLAEGSNDVVLFSGASWSEPSGAAMAPGLSPEAVLLFSGHVGQLTPTAEIVCITTDAFVVASPSGDGVLLRTGLKPGSIEVVTNADEIRAFLLQRGYGQEEPS
jgi:hypothetical protein